MAVIWFGLSDAVLSGLLDFTRDATSSTSAVRPALVSGLRCWQASVSSNACRLGWSRRGRALERAAGFRRSPSSSSSSLVGLALGLLVVVSSPRREVAWAILPLAVLLLWLFGGEWRTVSDMPTGPAIAGTIPSRWTFEGLLLLESRDPHGEQAERYFPADSQRMGLTTDTLALALMLIGLAGAAAFISVSSRRAP